uniref:Serine/threonine-protein kinase Chk2 n=1 Tax=Pygocentrus nattereri TaxID=42514 RepID=A0AAR2KDU9_PYGNA
MSEEAGPSGQSQSQSQSQTQSQPGSSSSSGPTSASQSSSGSGTLSSVDTVPVADLSSIPEEPEEPEAKYWGRMVPLIRGFTVHNCIEHHYYFGRDSRCDYAFNDPIILQSPRYKTYSKRHFRIFRDGKLVYLEDLSGNGTWVDDTEVGKGKKIPLNNNSVVSLADPKHKVFMFVDMTEDDQPNFPKEFREKYHVTRRIGSGVCGEVRLAIERETCKKVALKTINKNDFPSIGTATRNAEREIEILKKIDHPCLIKTEDFYQTDESYYIVLEYVEGGELFSRIKTEKQLKEDIAKLYFYQMLKAVEVIHPVWSLGVLLFICLGGYPPFNPESSAMPVRDQIMSGHYCFIRSQWQFVSSNAKDLVKKLLVVDPAKRLSISEALEHPWLKVRALSHLPCLVWTYRTFSLPARVRQLTRQIL